MNCFLLPKTFCGELQQLCAKFWWGSTENKRKIHWICWSELCKDREDGGLGFKNLYKFNIAMLAKQAWRISQRPESLIAQIYKARYFPSGSFWEAEAKGNMSYAWRSMLEARELLKKGLRWVVGNGRTIEVWKDAWIPQLPIGIPAPKTRGADYGVHVVADLILDDGSWNIRKLQECFQDFVAEHISLIPVSHSGQPDRIVWKGEKNGKFTVRSAYRLAIEGESWHQSESEENHKQMWKYMWKLKIPGKVKMHIWKCGVGILPTVSQLGTKGVYVQTGCPLCNGEWECIAHAMSECPIVQEVLEQWPAIMDVVTAAVNIYEVADWLAYCQHELCKKDFELLLVGIWSMWKERNMRLWRGKQLSTQALRCVIQNYYDQYQAANMNVQKRKAVKPKEAWKPPNLGWVKCNVKGLVDIGGQVAGIGVLFRDQDGMNIAGSARQILQISNVLKLEAIALRDACEMAVKHNLVPVRMECDSLTLFNMVKGSNTSHMEVGTLVHDVLDIADREHQIHFAVINKTANRAARIIAKIGQSSNSSINWVGKPPEIVESSLPTYCNN